MGFHFKELMIGALSPINDPETLIKAHFKVVARKKSWAEWLKDNSSELHGAVTVEGIGEDMPIYEGSLYMEPVFDKKLIYRFKFDDAQGRHYRFYGIKRIRWIKAPFTWTTLHSTLFREEEQIANGVLYFRWRDVPSFIAGWRLTAGPEPSVG